MPSINPLPPPSYPELTEGERLRDYLYNWETKGIFEQIDLVHESELGFFKSQEYDPKILDILYITNSGNKIASPLVEYFSENSDGQYPYLILGLAKSVFELFGRKWNNLYDTMISDYEILEDYYMKEELAREEAGSSQLVGSSNIAGDSRSTSSSQSADESEGTSQTRSDTMTDNKSSMHAFNSDIPTPTDKQEAVNVNLTTANTEGKTNSTSGNTAETESSTTTGTTSDGTRTLGVDQTITKSGRVGKSPQEMLKQQRELLLFSLHEKMFQDMDSILTVPIYL